MQWAGFARGHRHYSASHYGLGSRQGSGDDHLSNGLVLRSESLCLPFEVILGNGKEAGGRGVDKHPPRPLQNFYLSCFFCYLQ